MPEARMDRRAVDLLLDCLHQDATRLSSARLAATTADDWQNAVALAQIHGLESSLYWNALARGWSHAIPEAALTTLSQCIEVNTVGNLRMYDELRRLLAAFQERGVAPIVLKGAHLAKAVYGNVASRRIGDIDLLLRAADLEAAADVMRTLGYQSRVPYDLDVVRATEKHLPRFDKPDCRNVELHWNLATREEGCQIDPADIWQQARPARMSDAAVYELSSEHLLLHQCLHASYSHVFDQGLRPLCDIAAVVSHYGDALHWPSVIETATHWRAARGTYVALRLAHELLGAAVPADVLHALRPAGMDDALMTIAADRVMSVTEPATIGSTYLTRLVFSDNAAGGARMLLRRLFISRLELSGMYHVPADSIRIYLCYIQRLWDLLARYWRVGLAVVRGDRARVAAGNPTARLASWMVSAD